MVNFHGSQVQPHPHNPILLACMDDRFQLFSFNKEIQTDCYIFIGKIADCQIHPKMVISIAYLMLTHLINRGK